MKKKIGIMSMQRIVNYGSLLQAFGLKKILEDLEYNVQFVDYRYEEGISRLKDQSIIKKIISNINIIKFISKKAVLNNFRNKYNNEYIKLLGINCINYNPNIDALVIGSDEVFNCLQGYPVGYSRELFGKNYENINVISYAGSFGHTKYEELKEHNIDKEIGEYFSKFNAISVRDKNSESIVEKLTSKKPELHLDPVLISDFSKVITNNVKLNNYIIVYAYTGRLTKSEEKYIKKFAKKHKKKIVSLGFYQKIADYNLVVSPFEVLEYFQKADYVITDTFHGTIFSIKMNTKFCTIIRDSNKNKLMYLLEKLSQVDRNVTELDKIEELYNKDIDFKETNSIIEAERKRTTEYLKNNLK